MQNDKEFLIQKIRTQYKGREHTALDDLKALMQEARDAQIKAANEREAAAQKRIENLKKQ